MLRFPDLDFSSWLRSASAQSDNRFHIGARQIYILPTRFGLMFSVLVIAMLIGSINYANNLGFLLTFFLAGVGVISIVHTWLNLLDLEIVLFPVKPVFAGQDLAIQVRILNPSPKLRGSIELQVAENSQVVSHDITANTEQDFFLKIPVSRRGRYVFPRLTVSTQFPLGLFNAWCYINHPINAIVYAKPSAKVSLPFLSKPSENSEGLLGEGNDDFLSHRNYVVTDSLKHIDWKVFAREKGLKTKQFSGNKTSQLWLSLEFFPNVPFEQAVSHLTRAVIDAENDGLVYGLRLPNKQFDLNNGHQHKQQCLKALALVGL